MRRKFAVGIVTAALVLGITVAGGGAAQAASCTISYDQGAGGGVVSCSGFPIQAEVNAYVVCNAVSPFPSWTKYTGWRSAGSFVVSSATWPSCPWPASYSVGYATR